MPTASRSRKLAITGAYCPECHKLVQLSYTGKIPTHGPTYNLCPASLREYYIKAV